MVVGHGINLSNYYNLIQQEQAISSPPFVSSFVACRDCPLPIIRHMLRSRNSPSNLVTCRRHHPSLSLHHLPPHHLTRHIGHHPLFSQQHCCRHYRCNPVLILTALVAPFPFNCPVSARFPPAATIVTAIPFLAQTTVVAPSAA